jgi:hypothetical protein
MPKLTIWAVRAALLYLGMGFTVGALMLWNKGFALYPMVWTLLPLHIEVVLVGWTVQLAMGVVYWIAPRQWTSRGNVALAVISFALLNMGVLLAGLSGWLPSPEWFRIIGRGAEMLAVIVFVLHLWPRIKPAGSNPPRETSQ